MAKGIMVCEGEFEGVVTQSSKERLEAFMQGFTAGAYKYGAGSAAIYTRADLPHLDLDDKDDAKIAEWIETHLPLG